MGRYIARPITAQRESRRDLFDLTLLWDRRLEFALQLAFPQMSFASVYTDPMCPCLIDRASETMLLFRPTDSEHVQIEVRGESSLWDGVLAVYEQWRRRGQPDMKAYYMQIDAEGNQVVTLSPTTLRQGTPAWVLYPRTGTSPSFP